MLQPNNATTPTMQQLCLWIYSSRESETYNVYGNLKHFILIQCCILVMHQVCIFSFESEVLYEIMGQILQNKLHGPNALQNRCYMCIQWTRFLYSVITWQSNPPISQFNSLCNEFKSVWSMFVYNSTVIVLLRFKLSNRVLAVFSG